MKGFKKYHDGTTVTIKADYGNAAIQTGDESATDLIIAIYETLESIHSLVNEILSAVKNSADYSAFKTAIADTSSAIKTVDLEKSNRNP